MNVFLTSKKVCGSLTTKAKAALFTIRNTVDLTAFLKKQQKFCRTVVSKIKEFQQDAPTNNLEDILQPQILEELLKKATKCLGPPLCPLCEKKQSNI
jgi:hypothetical protein